MTRRGMMGLLVAGVAGLVLAACGSSRRYNYKMVVEVDTPEGLRSGSAVREVRYTNSPMEPRPHWTGRGEAVTVDLGGGRTLFALLTGMSGEVDYFHRDIDTIIREYGDAAPGGVIELWPAMPQTKMPKIGSPLPMLVRFRDIADPKSVERVEPEALDKAFRPGVKLKRITVQATDEDVTVGIEERLKWLPNYYSKRLDAQRFGDGLSFANSMSSGAFSTGANK